MARKTEMVICDPSYTGPAKAKVIGKVVRCTNIPGAPVSYLANEDGKLIDAGQIIIAQNDIYVTMMSCGHCALPRTGTLLS